MLINSFDNTQVHHSATGVNMKNEPTPMATESHQPVPSFSHLQRREIQAPIAACLIHGFAKELGLDKALEVAAASIREDAKKSGQAMAGQMGVNTLAALNCVVQEIWAEGGAVMIRKLEETDQKLSFDVTRCRYAEMYETMGMKELGFCLSCCRDESFASGFNPRIHLTRNQTIMQGASHCDFRFTLD
jgi:hypothetical protein